MAEADRTLKELAEGGHLEARACGAELSRALWRQDPLRRSEPDVLNEGK